MRLGCVFAFTFKNVFCVLRLRDAFAFSVCAMRFLFEFLLEVHVVPDSGSCAFPVSFTAENLGRMKILLTKVIYAFGSVFSIHLEPDGDGRFY